MPDPKVIQHFKDHTRLEWLVDWKDNLPAESKKDTDQGLSEEELTPLANPEPNNKAYMKMTPAELKSTREALYP